MIDLMEHLIDEDFADQFKPASGDEIGKRVLEYIKSECTQNPDGSWDCKSDIDLSEMGLKRLPVRFGNIGGYFNCCYNHLTTLEGSPKQVRGDFFCNSNQLTTLKGSPKQVSGNFLCGYNQLTTLKGIGEVGGTVYAMNNPVSEKELLATIGRHE